MSVKYFNYLFYINLDVTHRLLSLWIVCALLHLNHVDDLLVFFSLAGVVLITAM
jgi:hypothetical protein